MAWVSDEVYARESLTCYAKSYATVWATCWYSDDGRSLRHAQAAPGTPLRRAENDLEHESGLVVGKARGWAVMRLMDRPRNVTEDDEEAAARETGQARSPLEARNEAYLKQPFFYAVESIHDRVLTEGGCASPLVASLLRIVRIAGVSATHAPRGTPAFYILGVEARVPLVPPASELIRSDLTGALRHTGYAAALAAGYALASSTDSDNSALVRLDVSVRWIRNRLRSEGLPSRNGGPWVEDDELRSLGNAPSGDADQKKQSPVVSALRKAIGDPLANTLMAQTPGSKMAKERRALVANMRLADGQGRDEASNVQRVDCAREVVRRHCHALPGLPVNRLIVAFGGVSHRPDLEARILWHGVPLAEVCRFVEASQTRQTKHTRSGCTVESAVGALRYLHDCLMRRSATHVPSKVARDVLLPPPAFGRSLRIRTAGSTAEGRLSEEAVENGYRTFLASAQYHILQCMRAPVYLPWSRMRKKQFLSEETYQRVAWRNGVSQRDINEEAIAHATDSSTEHGGRPTKRARRESVDAAESYERGEEIKANAKMEDAALMESTNRMLSILIKPTHAYDAVRSCFVSLAYRSSQQRIGRAFARVCNLWRRAATQEIGSGASSLGPLTVRAYYCYRGDVHEDRQDPTRVVGRYIESTWGKNFKASVACLRSAGEGDRGMTWDRILRAFESSECVVVGDMARWNLTDMDTMAAAIEQLSERDALRCRHVIFVAQVNSMASRISEAIVAEAAELNVSVCEETLGRENSPASYDDLDGVVSIRGGVGPLGRGERSDVVFPETHRLEQLAFNASRLMYGLTSNEDIDSMCEGREEDREDEREALSSLLTSKRREKLQSAIGETISTMRRAGVFSGPSALSRQTVTVYVLYEKEETMRDIVTRLKSSGAGIRAGSVRVFKLKYSSMSTNAEKNDATFFNTTSGILCGASTTCPKYTGIDPTPHLVVMGDVDCATYRHVNLVFMGPAFKILALDVSREQFASMYLRSNMKTDLDTLSTRQTDDLSTAFASILET